MTESDERTTTTEAVPRTTYIFIDFENVQEVDLNLIQGKPVKVLLIVGHRRKTLPTPLAKQLHKYGGQVEYIESQGATRNALDLVLAYHVGAQAKADPNGYFVIVANDQDYDPLIEHLRANTILASRQGVFAHIPVLMDFARMPASESVDWVMGRLQKIATALPRTTKALLNTINTFYRKQLVNGQAEEIVKALEARKQIIIGSQGRVEYPGVVQPMAAAA